MKEIISNGLNEYPRYVLITGAAGGIGRALVKEFSNNGYRVIASDVVDRPVDLNCFSYVRADLLTMANSEDYAVEVFGKVKQLIGSSGLCGLINNAAIQILGGLDTLSRSCWSDTLHINLIAPFLWIQGMMSNLEAAKGAVVNVSSVHARLTKKNFVAYATSKAALSGMTRALAVDIGDRVRVNAIEPAAINTEMLKAGFEDDPQAYSKLVGCHPQNTIGTPEQLAVTARYLIEPGAEFIHGCCLTVDGGISGRLHDPL